jgi:glucokinase
MFTLGVDVGGTNVKLGLVDSRGRIIARNRLFTESYISKPIKLIDAISEQISLLLNAKKLKAKNIKGIGIGLPGLFRSLVHMVNFRCRNLIG